MADMAKAALSAGDSCMTRIYEHVKNGGGNIWEQIDKNTGEQASATGLTWSYANILEALHFRNYTMEKLQSFKTVTSA
jgi:GH15 family glucan-1,4-alpha-glucosidase